MLIKKYIHNNVEYIFILLILEEDYGQDISLRFYNQNNEADKYLKKH